MIPLSVACLTASMAAALCVAPRSQQPAGTLAQRLRGYNAAADYAGGVLEAGRHPAELRRDPRARAWYALLLARDDRATEALALADDMVRRDRRSPWGWFAKAAALDYGPWDSSTAVLATSEQMYHRAPRDPDIAWFRAASLMNNSKAPEAIALLDSLRAEYPASLDFLLLRANATWSLAGQSHPVSRALRDSATAFWTLARSRDSTDVRGWAWPGARIGAMGRLDESVALLTRAVALAPASAGVATDYFRALRSANVRDLAAARSLALPRIADIVVARGSDPTVLRAMASEYHAFGVADSQKALEDRLLQAFPASGAAEWVLVDRYREVGQMAHDTVHRDSTAMPRYVALLRGFLARPHFVKEVLRGDAYRELFFADTAMSAESLFTVVQGMVRYEGINPHITYAMGAIRLADRGTHLAEAEQLARDGVAAGRRRVDQGRPYYESTGDYALALDRMNATMADALGWVEFRSGRVAEADSDLHRSLDLDPKNLSALNHLGRLFESRNQLDSAEAYYERGVMVATFGVNPNTGALRSLYQTRHGSLDGFDAYQAGIRDRDRERRRAEIHGEIKATREALPAFDLVSLDGSHVRSDSLMGHILVINFWGKWCGPCVVEMPELQRFWRQVAADTLVRLLTIDNDTDLDSLRVWLTRHQLDLPVLLDAGYAGRNGVNAYPTTWFVDRAGRIAFVKTGWSVQLAEEFGWRADMLRPEGTPRP